MNKWQIVGLGNPGEKYRFTRHNIGFLVLDAIADKYSATFRGGFEADYSVVDIFGKRCYLVKPQTYMNLSGKAVSEISDYFDIPKEHTVVIHDDLDIEFGRLKVKVGGSSGGHKGINSIISCFSIENFIRVKMGIGKPISGDVSSFVLSDFNKEEKSVLEDFIELGMNATLSILERDVKYAMNLYNNKKITQEVQERCQV